MFIRHCDSGHVNVIAVIGPCFICSLEFRDAQACFRMAFQCCVCCADVKRPERISRQVSPGNELRREDGLREEKDGMKRPSKNIGIAMGIARQQTPPKAPKIDGGGGTGATGATGATSAEADSGATTEAKTNELMPFKRQKTRDAGNALQRRKTAAMEDYLQALPEGQCGSGCLWSV